MNTLTFEIQVPLIKRHHRFIVANGKMYFIGTVGGGMNLSWNIFEVDECGNRVFSQGFKSLEKLSTEVYKHLGEYEVFSVEDHEFIVSDTVH